MIDCQPIQLETTTPMIEQLVIAPNKEYVFAVLYSLKLPRIEKGDILSLTSAYEMTNDHKHEVMIASSVTLAKDETDVLGKRIDEARGYNIDHVMHHGTSYHARQYKFDDIVPEGHYLNTVVWAATYTADKHYRDFLKVEKVSGHLDAVIFRANCGVK